MTEKEILNRIYPSVVTFMGDYKTMIADVKRLKLEKISLFLTGVGYKDRQNIYQLLQETSLKQISHVHARHDMKEKEYDFLVKVFKTKAFTLHYQYIKNVAKSQHKKKIFIENNWGTNAIKDPRKLKTLGGACLDLSHIVHQKKFYSDVYPITMEIAKNFKIGCNHVSAVLPDGKSWHYAKKNSEFDYLKTLPKKYFSRYINLEVGNPIPEQLRFKKYIAKILYKTWKTKS